MYRIVVAEKEAPRDGRFVDILGTYNPRAADTEQVTVDAEKAREWIGKGATPSLTVASLLRKAGVFNQTPATPATPASA